MENETASCALRGAAVAAVDPARPAAAMLRCPDAGLAAAGEVEIDVVAHPGSPFPRDVTPRAKRTMRLGAPTGHRHEWPRDRDGRPRACETNRRGGRASNVARRRRTSALLRLRELVLDRPQRCLGPRREAELAEDVRDVRPRRPFGDEQLRADLLVRETLAEQPQDVLLAIGQRLDRVLAPSSSHLCARGAG